MIQNIFAAISEARKGLRRPLRQLAVAAISAGVSVWTLAAIAEPAVLAPQPERNSDGAIHRDSGIYRDTQLRIKALNDDGRRIADYHLSKAQCWLDVSFHEYSRNDRGNFPQDALGESRRILAALEAGKDPGWDTPLVNGAEKLRADLWGRHEALKKHAGFQCAAQQTACAEVELVHAGNEIHDAGWRHAKPYLQIAEDLTGAAEQAAAACLPPPTAAPVAVAPVTPAAVKITLSADALFRFDRSGAGDLLPKGRAELDQLAQDIAQAGIGALSVIGHTDRLGTAAYNLRLSRARAETVKTYLQQRGVAVPIAAEGRGMLEPIEACGGVTPHSTLIACLQPNRRVEVVFQESGKP